MRHNLKISVSKEPHHEADPAAGLPHHETLPNGRGVRREVAKVELSDNAAHFIRPPFCIDLLRTAH